MFDAAGEVFWVCVELSVNRGVVPEERVTLRITLHVTPPAGLEVELDALLRPVQTQEREDRFHLRRWGLLFRPIVGSPPLTAALFQPREDEFEVLVIRLLHAFLACSPVTIAAAPRPSLRREVPAVEVEAALLEMTTSLAQFVECRAERIRECTGVQALVNVETIGFAARYEWAIVWLKAELLQEVLLFDSRERVRADRGVKSIGDLVSAVSHLRQCELNPAARVRRRRFGPDAYVYVGHLQLRRGRHSMIRLRERETTRDASGDAQHIPPEPPIRRNGPVFTLGREALFVQRLQRIGRRFSGKRPRGPPARTLRPWEASELGGERKLLPLVFTTSQPVRTLLRVGTRSRRPIRWSLGPPPGRQRCKCLIVA